MVAPLGPNVYAPNTYIPKVACALLKRAPSHLHQALLHLQLIIMTYTDMVGDEGVFGSALTISWVKVCYMH